MQKIWSAIIVTRKGTTKKKKENCRVLKQDLEDKKKIRKVLQIQLVLPMTSLMIVRLGQILSQFH
jgi:hypothetical protein